MYMSYAHIYIYTHIHTYYIIYIYKVYISIHCQAWPEISHSSHSTMQVTVFPSGLWFLPLRILDVLTCDAEGKKHEEIVMIRTDDHSKLHKLVLASTMVCEAIIFHIARSKNIRRSRTSQSWHTCHTSWSTASTQWRSIKFHMFNIKNCQRVSTAMWKHDRHSRRVFTMQHAAPPACCPQQVVAWSCPDSP